MIYFASRSSRKYLLKLKEVAAISEPHHILSVTGGLAVLHAIGPGCKSLTLVDRDSEVNLYAHMLLELFYACPTMQQFFGMLTGYTVVELGNNQFAFTDKFDGYEALAQELSPSSTQMLAKTYGNMEFNPVSGDGLIGSATIHFLSNSNQINHFNWLLGFQAFSSEASYRSVRQIILSIPLGLHDLNLEDFNFRAVSETTLVLASNTDSPLFTKGDIALRAIQRAANPLVHYISKTRDLRLEKLAPFNMADLALLPQTALFAGLTAEETKIMCSIGIQKFIAISDQNLITELRYDEALVVCSLSRREKGDAVDTLIDFLVRDIPIFQRLLLFSDKPDIVSVPECLSGICPPYAVVYTESYRETTLTILELCHRIAD